MDEPFVTATADEVRALIASLWLGAAGPTRTIGDVRLAPHQISAIARIRASFEEFGGAFLCDAVGSGKTFIGLAVAAEFKTSVVIAPAGLRSMWMKAMERASVPARFLTVESLSRRASRAEDANVIVVDEAHHFRNAPTLRHRNLAALIQRRPVLFMSATPIHNARRDLETLASLFLGSRARHLTDSELARVIVRREKDQIQASAIIPRVAPTRWFSIGDDPVIAGALMSLPPPVPSRDAGEAVFLAAHGLLRQWASSEGALRAAIDRRLARAYALESSLEAGDYPSEVELRNWITADGSIQLNLAGLFTPNSHPQSASLLSAVRSHASALKQVSSLLTHRKNLDAARVATLRTIRATHPGTRIIAFSSYEATIRTLFHELASDGGAAALTSRGGLVAGGRASRAEVIDQFAPTGRKPSASDRITLLLTTDLLSEGVDLQRAEAVVHLDLPWTAARIEQRIGRIARIGSRHDCVAVYGFRPPPSADRVLRASALLGEKWRAASAVLGKQAAIGIEAAEHLEAKAPAEAHERMLVTIERWKCDRIEMPDTAPLVATVTSVLAGFIALIETAGGSIMISSSGKGVTELPGETEKLCSAASGECTSNSATEIDAAFDEIQRWLTARKASSIAGLGGSEFLRSRRRILAQIDSAAAQTPLHMRANRAHLIQMARASATQVHPAAEEEVISALGADPHPIANERLEQIAAMTSVHKNELGRDTDFRVRALLILRATSLA